MATVANLFRSLYYHDGSCLGQTMVGKMGQYTRSANHAEYLERPLGWELVYAHNTTETFGPTGPLTVHRIVKRTNPLVET